MQFAGVATYVAACRHLAVPPAPPDIDALAAVRSPLLRASAVRSDAHAAALCTAILAAHHVSPSLVVRFLATYDPLLRPPALDHVLYERRRPDPPATAPPATAPPFLLDLSDSPALTSRGAAAALAALHLLHTRPSVELDLRRTAVTHLCLAPWHSLLSSARASHRITSSFYAASVASSSSASTSPSPLPLPLQLPPVLGLALDECPIRTFDRACLAALAPLRWLSMRRTSFANPTRLADIVRALPALVAGLFATDPTCDASLDAARRIALSPPERQSQQVRAQHHQHHQQHPHTQQPSATMIPQQTHSQTQKPELQLDDDILGELHIPGAVNPAPRAHPLRNYLLAHALPALRWLDGRTVSAVERNAAREAMQTAFESATKAPSLAAMLRHRELGLGLRARTAGAKPRDPHHLRPKKRRRVLDFTPRPAELLAALAAAGFPPVPRPSALTQHTQIALALAAASSSMQVPPSHGLRQVRDAALSLVQPVRPHLTRNSPPPPPPPPSRPLQPPQPHVGLQEAAQEVQAQSPQLHSPPQPQAPVRAKMPGQERVRKSATGGLVDFCGSIFERAVSTALIRQPGAPRTEYLHHAGDRPRQFEYSPANPAELVYGTELGHLVVLNQETGAVRGSCQVGGGIGNRKPGEVLARSHNLDSAIEHAQRSWSGDGTPRARHRASPAVFGLSWLNKRPDMFISGSNNGAIHVYNVAWMSACGRSGSMYACETFTGLTSIHVNADDSRFAVSGESEHVGVFDLATGRRLELMRNCHGDMINVIKFAHNNPYVLVTSSFDRTVKKWDLRESRPGGGRRPIFTTASRTDNMMACFSPDDSHLLVSAVDNEVRQFSAVDGRLVREFDIPKTDSRLNFTRSYYMNDRDYIITGSSMESSVRVFNARTGAYLTQVDMDERDVAAGRGLLVQSLRANPSRRFNFSALLVSKDNPALDLIANVDLHTRA